MTSDSVGDIEGSRTSFMVGYLTLCQSDVKPARDAIAFGGGTIVVMTIALTASLVPAWRASRTDPLKALRHQ